MDSEKLVEALVDFANALESLAVNLRRQIQPSSKTEDKTVIPEDRFNLLKWESERGNKLGDYEVAYKKANKMEEWQHCWNILKANNSAINNRFFEEGYSYSYWAFPEKYADRIFRKKLEERRA